MPKPDIYPITSRILFLDVVVGVGLAIFCGGIEGLIGRYVHIPGEVFIRNFCVAMVIVIVFKMNRRIARNAKRSSRTDGH